MHNQKLKRYIIMATVVLVLVAALVCTIVFGSANLLKTRRSAAYIQSLGGLTIYSNSLQDAYAQTIIRDVIDAHINNNDSGKAPKVLFIGYDGCQAIMPSLNYGSSDSAITKVARTGGLYLTYAGGANIGDQATSTAPGWASIFTGVWATENGVKDNNNVLNEATRSILFEMGAKGLATSYSVSWATHIKGTYKNEVAFAKANNYPVSYNLSADGDNETFNNMLASINKGDVGVFGILEYPDHAGHTSGFKLANPKYEASYFTSEQKAMQLIASVENRDTYAQEDWLIIITTDHGGYKLNHGGTTPMERYTFLAINKPLA